MSLKPVSSCLALLVVAAGAALAQPKPATFHYPHKYPAGDTPSLAVIADFNHDGKPDLAVGTNSGVAMLLNNGNGFAPPVTYAAGGETQSMAVADFNRDGNLDIAVAAGTDSIYLLFGNANGTFQTAAAIALPSKAYSVIAGDFNGDGIPDLAVAGGSILILLGDGHGGFGAPIATTLKLPAAALAAGDFNHDGKLDLAVDLTYWTASGPFAVREYALVTLPGNGDGTFQAAQLVLNRYASFPILVADIDGNGTADIVMPGSFLLGNGDGTFQPQVYYPTEGIADSTALADVNGDGHIDILSANGSGSLSISLGNASGIFQPPYSYIAGFHPLWIGTADFLGHGYQDMVAIVGTSVELIPGARDGKYRAQPTIDLNQTAVGNPVMADFNGDGNLDAAVLSYGSSISILLGNGKGGFRPIVPAVAGPAPVALVAGDFNGDGKADLAVADRTTQLIYILAGNGDGTFSAGATVPVPTNCGQSFCDMIVATADLNRDGKLDLVVLSGDINVTGTAVAQAFLGNGDGTFGAPLSIGSGLEVRQFAVGDFNADGYPDLVFSNVQNGPQLFLGNGNGTFQGPVSLYSGFPTGILAGDFNGDGKLDLAFTNDQSQLIILFGNGNGTFQPGPTTPFLFSGDTLVATDLNGDGRLDLLTNGPGTTFTIYLGNGDGTFTQQTGPPISCVSQMFCGFAFGDVNGDGKPDIFSVQTGNEFLITPITVLVNTTP